MKREPLNTEEPYQSRWCAMWSRVRARSTPLLVAVIAALVVVIAVLAAGRGDDDTRALAGVTTPSTLRSGSVESGALKTESTAVIPQGFSWQDALAHEGESVTILGLVVSAVYAESSNGSPTFLNLGVDYPDTERFTVLIWGDDRYRFSAPPEDMYAGRKIAVTGVVHRYKGVAEIIVSDPSQIEIY